MMKYRKFDKARILQDCDIGIGSPYMCAPPTSRNEQRFNLLFRVSNLEISQNRSKAALLYLISIGEADIREGRFSSADDFFQDFEQERTE
jgi:hypothetical protein